MRLINVFVGIFLFGWSCNNPEPVTLLEDAPLIPLPREISSTGQVFELSPATLIESNKDEDAGHVSSLLSEGILELTGLKINESRDGDIQFQLVQDSSLGSEGYKLSLSTSKVSIEAYKPAGLFYGVQTLLQIIPITASQDVKRNTSFPLPTGHIRDVPEYAYRGAMLDVSRHFFPVGDVLRFVDFLSWYKVNMLHLHLTDDQGWRIEIKSWPELAVRGGSTQVGGGVGGYYTQKDYQAIVAYADKKNITIVPEIDMPGHTNAALVSYPQLNCNGRSPELYTGTEVGFSSLCVDKEVTYRFIDDVISELASITPGPYIHIGGDESHATKKEDYISFINQVQQIMDRHGKTMIGWDEIVQADLSNNTVIQHWANEEFAKMAVDKNLKLIMSPAKRAYLDMKYDSTTQLGLSWAGFIEVDKAYDWDPANFVNGVTKENLLGVEGPLWSETISNIDEIEFMIFPRLPGLAELGWSGAKSNWEEYRIRLGKHGPYMNALNIDYYHSLKVNWASY